MTLRISPHAIEQDQGPFIFPGILVGSGPGLPSAPDGLLHVWDGSAGAVTAHANADELVVESDGLGGISILVPGDTWANIYFGSATVNNAGFIRYGGVTNQLEFGVNQATIAAWSPGQVVFSGTPFSIFSSGVLALEAVTEIVVNDRGDDVDFRVEGVGETHAFFVQSSDGKAGFGTATIPHGGVGRARVAIEGANSSADGPHMQFTTTYDDYPLIQIWPYAHDNLGIGFDCYYQTGFKSSFADSSYVIYKGSNVLHIQYGQANPGVGLALTPRISISGSDVVINQDGLDVDFRVESDNDTHALFVQGSDGNVGFGTATPQSSLHLVGTFSTDWNVTYQHYEAAWAGGGNATRPYLAKGWTSGPGDWLYLSGSGNQTNANQSAMVLTASEGVKFGRGLDIPNGILVTEWMRIDTSGNVGIGIVAGDGTLHVHTATAGVVTAHGHANDLIVENSDHAGISILAPDDKQAAIYFGFPTQSDRAYVAAYLNSLYVSVAGAWRIFLTATEHRSQVPITILEQAAAAVSVAGYGQLWMKDDAPNILMFTDDAGTDFTVDITPV